MCPSGSAIFVWPDQIPAVLVMEMDTGYYDDFTSLEDMAKYTEVRKKQRKVDKIKEKEEQFRRGVWRKNGPGVKALMLMEAVLCVSLPCH